MTPASGALDVTANAYVRVRYSPGYFDDPIIDADPQNSIWLERERPGEEPEPVPGRIERVGDYLFFLPDELLEASSPFDPDDGYVTHALGFDVDEETFTFDVPAEREDLQPPQLTGIRTLSASEVDASCDAPRGGFRIDVQFAPARDDGPAGSIEYLLYQTRGANLDAPRLVGRQRHFVGEVIPMAFVLPPAEAVEPICVTVHAVDGVGNVDESVRAQCIDPVQGDYFESLCAVAAPGAASGGATSTFACLGALAAMFLAFRRRRAR